MKEIIKSQIKEAFASFDSDVFLEKVECEYQAQLQQYFVDIIWRCRCKNGATELITKVSFLSWEDLLRGLIGWIKSEVKKHLQEDKLAG